MSMKHITKYIMLLTVILMLCGCSDFLNNKPKGMTIPSSVEDYIKLMNDIYYAIDETTLYLTDDVKLLDKDASASYLIYLNKNDYIRNLYSFQPGQVYLKGNSDYLWNDAYSNIFTFNVVINDVLKSEGTNENLKQQIRAEALIARAYEYLHLVNAYAVQYDVSTAASDYGVPFITEADINQNITRNTVAEVYENIISDINEAIPYLAESVNFTTHPNKTAAYALLAKVYLCMGNYSQALDNANKVISAKNSLIDLKQYEVSEGTTWGRVHLIGDESISLPDEDSPEAIWTKISRGGLQGEICASESLRSVFKEDLASDSQDLRKEYFFAENEVDFGGSPMYFPGECAYVLYSYHPVGLTTSENLLIAAECEARIGSVEKAMDYVNYLRDNRISNNVPLTAENSSDALAKVLREKRREFCMRGDYRYMDLKRLNKDASTAVTVTHSVDGETWTLAPNDAKWILPISQEVLDYNPNMPQYDRN